MKWCQVLEWRDAEFAELDAEAATGATAGPAAGATAAGPPGVWLPFDRQKAIQNEHWRKWLKDPENKEKLGKVAKRHDGVKNKMNRDLKTM